MSSLPTSPEPCSCHGPGFCERHGIRKSTHWHHLCQTRDDYRADWDAGKGPGQVLSRPGADTVSAKPVREGWGNAVERYLKMLGITEDRYKAVKKMFGLPPTCGCPQRREWLNRVGRWWNGEEIGDAN